MDKEWLAIYAIAALLILMVCSFIVYSIYNLYVIHPELRMKYNAMTCEELKSQALITDHWAILDRAINVACH